MSYDQEFQETQKYLDRLAKANTPAEIVAIKHTFESVLAGAPKQTFEVPEEK